MQSIAKLLREKVLVGLSLSSLVIITLLAQANPYFYTPNRDNGFFLYAGRMILKGSLLYHHIWDSKPPAIFYMDAFGLWIGGGTRWGIWLLEFCFLFLAAWLGYALLKRCWQPGAAVFGTLVWIWGLSHVIVTGNLIEEYPLLFNFLALFLFIQSVQKPQQRIFDILIGNTAALSFLFRANNMGVQIAIILAWAVWAIFNRQVVLFFQRMGSMTLGAIMPLLATAVYFWSLGTLSDAVDAALWYNFAYTGGHTNFQYSILKGFSFLGIPAWITLAGYLLVLILTLKTWRTAFTQPLKLLLLFFWPVEVALSGLSGRGYDHYFVSWAPAMALTCGFLYHTLSSQAKIKNTAQLLNRLAEIILTVITLLVLFFNREIVLEYRRTFLDILVDHKTSYEISTPLIEYIQEHTRPDDPVLAWGGQAGINYMAQRQAPTAYLWYPLYLDSPLTPALNQGFFEDISHNRPELVIDAYSDAPEDVLSLNPDKRLDQLNSGNYWLNLSEKTTNLKQVYAFFDTYYTLETNIGQYGVYRLKKSE